MFRGEHITSVQVAKFSKPLHHHDEPPHGDDNKKSPEGGQQCFLSKNRKSLFDS